MHTHNPAVKTELDHYLQSMDLNDLEQLNRERKSSKRLDGGPYV